MSIPIKYIKRNDRQPYYHAKVTDSDGSAVDITGATIYCTMVDYATRTTKKIDHQSGGTNITDGPNGEFEYQWQSGDTDTTGKYLIEFEIDPGAGNKFTVPADPDDEAIVYILPDFDAS